MQPTNEQIQIQTYKVGKAETRAATLTLISLLSRQSGHVYFLVEEDDH